MRGSGEWDDVPFLVGATTVRRVFGSRSVDVRMKLTISAVVVALGVVLSACSGSAPDRSASGETTTTGAVSTIDPAPATSSTITTVETESTTTVSAPVDERTSTTSTTSTSPGDPTSSTSSTVVTTTSTTVAEIVPETLDVFPCARSVRLGPLEMLAGTPDGCLSRTGLEWTSTTKVLVGGMEFRPESADALVTFDPLNAHLHSVGFTAHGTVLGGDLLIDDGVIDWSFQYTESQSSALGWAMPIQSDTIKRSTIARLSGLEDVDSYPRQPVNGFPDYTVVTDGSVTQLVASVPSIATADVVFTLDQVGLKTIPPLTFSLPSEIIQKVAGLQIDLAVTVQPVERAGDIGLALFGRLRLPSVLQGYNGELGIFWPVNGSARLEKLMVRIAEIDLAVVRLEGVDLQYSVGDDLWAGKVNVLFGPGADALGFGGTIRIQNGELKEIGVVVQGLPLNIYGVASINSLGGSLRFDPFGIKASSQVGVGPFVPQVGNVAVIDGELLIDADELSIFGEGSVGTIRIGAIELKGMRVGDMKVSYYWDGLAHISGNGELYLDAAKQWGVGVGLRGAANASDISLGGDATLSLGILKFGASSAVSAKGVIACGILKGLWFDDARLGLSKSWSETAWRLHGDECNTKEYEVPVAPVDGSTGKGTGRNAAGGEADGNSFDVVVADGQKMVTFAIDGSIDSATVTAPDGTVIDVTGREQSTQSDPIDPRWMVIHEPGDTISYVVHGRPMGGTWRVTTSGASVPKVTTSVVDAKSMAREASTPALEPTSVGAPLTAVPETPAGSSGGDFPVLMFVLVLAALSAGLALTLVMVHRRSDAS